MCAVLAQSHTNIACRLLCIDSRLNAARTLRNGTSYGVFDTGTGCRQGILARDSMYIVGSRLPLEVGEEE